MSSNSPSLDDLRVAVRLACRPQNAWRIESGRRHVLAMPRDWVLQHIERTAAESLDSNDYWEYRRLLELAELLDISLVQRLVAVGLASTDSDVREAATDFS